MKNKEKVVKKKKNGHGMVIRMETPQVLQVNHVLYAAMEKYGAKPIVKQLWANCLMESAYSNSPLIGMISSKNETKKLIDNAEAANVLYYVVKHWDELKAKGKEEFQKGREKSENIS